MLHLHALNLLQAQELRKKVSCNVYKICILFIAVNHERKRALQ